MLELFNIYPLITAYVTMMFITWIVTSTWVIFEDEADFGDAIKISFVSLVLSLVWPVILVAIAGKLVAGSLGI